jgi:hypothetical protein
MKPNVTINLAKLCDNIVIVTSDVNNASEVKEVVEKALCNMMQRANESFKEPNQETQE